MEIEAWKKAVESHVDSIDKLVEDRRKLREELEKHLKQCFGYHEIEFSRDFSQITLKWEYNHNPIFKPDTMSKLGMDCVIKAEYDDKAMRIVVIEIYPFGVEEGYQYPQ